MCLSSISNFEVNQDHGWQIFLRHNKCKTRYESRFRRVLDSDVYEANKWYAAKSGKIEAFVGTIPRENTVFCKYEAGFHIFLSRKDARIFNQIHTYSLLRRKNGIIRKVCFRNIDHLDLAKALEILLKELNNDK